MDIEGSEFSVIQSLNKLTVQQICIEFHHWLNSEADPYPGTDVRHDYTLQDTLDCIDKIRSMGYKLVYISDDDDRKCIQETLFIKEDSASDYNDIEPLHYLKAEKKDHLFGFIIERFSMKPIGYFRNKVTSENEEILKFYKQHFENIRGRHGQFRSGWGSS